MRSTLRALATGMILMAACSSANDPTSGVGAEDATPAAKTTITIVAKDLVYDQTTLSVRAGSAFRIVLDNQDEGQQHNVAIYTDDTAATNVFRGELFAGISSRTYDAPAIDAGSYVFRCDVHPDEMRGTVTAT